MNQAKNKSKAKIARTAKVQRQRRPKKPAVGKNEEVEKLIHLLQVNQIELEHQNQELRIAEQELEVSRNKYVNLFDFSPIPYFVLGVDGVTKEVNVSASTMFGVDRSKLVGKHFIAYVPLDERDVFNAFVKSVFTSPVKQSCKMKVFTKDKVVRHVQLEGVKLDNIFEPDQQCHIAIIDLTEYKQS
ncbi:MAG: PAS domain-containing protein [Ignavibacteriales bacterium]|nr:PAS domain-containing protein [Ignavibacteriales bacterium]